MAQLQNKSKQKKTLDNKVKRMGVTLRSLNGAGFEFEDLTCAMQMVKALSGEKAPAIAGVATVFQAQVSTLGWRIDDLLLTAQTNTGQCRLAISVKGNFQVSSAGLPADFVSLAWEQWRDLEGPFDRTVDGLALVTLGTHPEFAPTWREVKYACSGKDTAQALSRIRSSKKQSKIFDSVRRPGSATDEEAIKLIRCLHVLPNDLQNEHSDNMAEAIGKCRRLLESGSSKDAQALWECLINVAKEVRLHSGTITVPDLLSQLRGQFGLRHHPDFERDWDTLFNISTDYKERIETKLPSGYEVPRTAEKESLQKAVADHPVTVVLGESGSGKSALVKVVLDSVFTSWNQVWFGPEELRTALSAARRSSLPLSHELSLVLNATVKPKNVLVIDSAERIEASEFVVIRQLLQAILPSEDTKQTWQVIIVTQTHYWVEGEEKMFGGGKAHIVEVGTLKSDVVKRALLPSPSLCWLAAHDETIAALTNLRTLAWVIKAGAALGSSAGGLASHTAIADGLWKYWTQDRANVQALMMRLAQREASFERSFALTDLESADTITFSQKPKELPLRLNERTNRIEFEHDLAADWARFQFLKQVWTDTPQWAALASNPLWMNALRMLGQFLLRQMLETGTAWDAAFGLADDTRNELAGEILLDALCLDPDAQRFLTERVDVLFCNNAKHFTKLLQRFHHIATVPTNDGMGLSARIGLHMDAQYRSVVFGRWQPVLRFLIAHRERLVGLVSSALAKVIKTWLTKTPRILSGGNPTPFRLEMAEIALAMARTVQVEKACGVMYVTCEPVLYSAALAGAADLPTEVGNWALELAGRREVDADVKKRIADIQIHKNKTHAERLETDAEYNARYEDRKQMPGFAGLFHELLPPWPLGASGKVDVDFISACIKESGIQFLMRAQPELAAEVLLALIIEDQPVREYGSERFEIDLGLKYDRDTYPTAFWKSPFFPFFSLAPDVALSSLIELVNFCTERWVATAQKGQNNEALGVTLQLADGSNKTFTGWWHVFDWPQSNDSMRNGSLYCALDALERWFIQRLDAGEDITADIDTILSKGNSVALVSVLLNVAKYRPSLLKGPLTALFTSPDLLYWDDIRVEKVEHNFVDWSWNQYGQAIFDFAYDWALAPHRQRKLLAVLVELLLTEEVIAQYLQRLLPTWDLPQGGELVLQFKLMFAELNRANYQMVIDPATGEEAQSFVCPDELLLELQSQQREREENITCILLPDHCEQRLRDGQPLTDEEALYLYNLLQECNSRADGQNTYTESRFRFAVVSTLVVLGSTWLAQNLEVQKYVLNSVRAGVESIASTDHEIRDRYTGSHRDDLKFIAYAVMHLWLADGDDSKEWEAAVLRLLTSGDVRATAVVTSIAYINREQLGSAWWRLLHAGLFWACLIQLAPHAGDGEVAGRTWRVWIARLRRFPLRGFSATPEQINFKRVVAGQERLDFRRRARRYNAGDTPGRVPPVRKQGGSLDNRVLEVLFNWLIKGDGTGNRDSDTRLALGIWDYDVTRAKTSQENEYGKYDLPSQKLGYDILLKLAALTVSDPVRECPAVWKSVFAHGPAAHYALRHFIHGLFQQLLKGGDPVVFERVWRAIVEYALEADWSQPGLWYHGEILICDLLGFGNENALALLQRGAAQRMKDLYNRWAVVHLTRDEECVARFCDFLISKFGVSLRIDGLCWLATLLKEHECSKLWYRTGASDALVGLVTVALESDVQILSKHVEARQAIVDIVATLVAMNIPDSLALQERIKIRLR